MVFSSLTFVAFFLPAIILFHFLFKSSKWRNGVLVAFSLLFYGWGEPVWIFTMLLTVTVNYICARCIGRSRGRRQKRFWMLLGVTLSLGFLFYFKYSGFVIDNIAACLHITHGFEAPVLPIGISFFTFQVLTYTIDVYQGKVEVQKNYARLLLYVSFFPQLIAGPIVNYADIEGQLEKRSIEWNQFYQGFQRFFIGFGKKVLLANTCGIVTEKLPQLQDLSVVGAWLLVFAYGLQIYFDFSGYSDMAIGMGKMFGFHFRENFNYPYISKSVTEFWRRWHISLGAFFREYVYIPLGGNRCSKGKNLCNIMLVWLLTGVWHGASWNFLVWGLYFGSWLVIEKFFLLRIKEKLPAIWNHVGTLLVILISWALFYYIDMGEAMKHLGIMFGMVERPMTDAVTIYYFKYYAVFLVAGVFACVPWKQVCARIFAKKASAGEHKVLSKIAAVLKPVVVTIIFMMSMSLLIGQSYNPFLYFRF